MQTMPDKTFTFTVPNDDGTPVYTATPQGDYWRVQWQDDGKFREVQYPHATAQRCVERGVWVIQVPGTRTVDSLPEAGGYKLGDKVRVTNKGQTHSCYERWAMAHDLKNWSNGKAPLNGHVLTVVEIGYFFDRDEVSPMLFGLQDEAGNTFIVNSNGFEAVAAKQDDAAFVAKTIELRVELAGINKQLEALTARAKTIRTLLTGE